MYMRASSHITKTAQCAERMGFGNESGELGTSLIPRPCTVHIDIGSN